MLHFTRLAWWHAGSDFLAHLANSIQLSAVSCLISYPASTGHLVELPRSCLCSKKKKCCNLRTLCIIKVNMKANINYSCRAWWWNYQSFYKKMGPYSWCLIDGIDANILIYTALNWLKQTNVWRYYRHEIFHFNCICRTFSSLYHFSTLHMHMK